MHSYGLTRAIPVVSSCSDSLFQALFSLIATEFDEKFLRLYIVQSFLLYIYIGLVGNTTTIKHGHINPQQG
jgi:hypothetical protein